MNRLSAGRAVLLSFILSCQPMQPGASVLSDALAPLSKNDPFVLMGVEFQERHLGQVVLQGAADRVWGQEPTASVATLTFFHKPQGSKALIGPFAADSLRFDLTTGDATFEAPTGRWAEDEQFTARSGRFLPEQNRVVLEGPVRVWGPARELAGSSLEIDLTTREARLRGPVSGRQKPPPKGP